MLLAHPDSTHSLLTQWREPDGELISHRLFTAADLRRAGLSKRRIRAAVASGVLVHVRRGVYLRAGVTRDVVVAASASGRLACVSALTPLGVFVRDRPVPHIHFARD
ncbi:MAG: type IV toxin-antitoxin system AbiEi family antitoxin domain-containing protein, partial [Actinobacteria bacterium]|nr:type IV toxin-antitoxin system AbiEi family antitoxin domain-containing protein [Actinomycetota bacterium]